jgi:hypothetical protein
MEHGAQGYPVGQTFETQYYGQCRACLGEINPGDRVFYVTQESLIHKSCPTSDEPPAEHVDGASDSNEPVEF